MATAALSAALSSVPTTAIAAYRTIREAAPRWIVTARAISAAPRRRLADTSNVRRSTRSTQTPIGIATSSRTSA